MLQVKDTLRSTVNLTFDGRVIKTYRGPKAQERFENESRILKFLEEQECPFFRVKQGEDESIARRSCEV